MNLRPRRSVEKIRGNRSPAPRHDCFRRPDRRPFGREFFDWITHDKRYARKLTQFRNIVNPAGMREIKDYPNLTAAMDQRGWKEARIRKVMGENWVRLLKEVWGA